jgi:hypothetical protein
MEKMTETGNNIIFATGAPGSKWSRMLSLIGLHPAINSSDKHKMPKYHQSQIFSNGKVANIGNHSGTYFGPYNGFGENFDDLTKISKEDFLEEIKRPFDNWDEGIKIVKSHWFSYGNNLNWLKENFPDSTIILLYNGEDVAFKWWHFVGGWDITFPVYTWYKDDVTMYNRIKEENQGIVSFARENLIPIKYYNSFRGIFRELGLSDNLGFLKVLSDQEDIDLVIKFSSEGKGIVDTFNTSVRGAALGIFYSNSTRCIDVNEVNDVFTQSKIKAEERHRFFEIDYLLEEKYDKNWLDQINNIVTETDAIILDK